MEWNVFWHNPNSKTLELFNVLNHGGIIADLSKYFKDLHKGKKVEEFKEFLRRTTMYYFWSKCEYEVLIYPWPNHDSDVPTKVDVYWQLQMNFQQFADYVWEHREEIRKIVL